MFLLDRFFDGTFFTYGIEVMSFADRDQEDRIDPMIYVFPRYWDYQKKYICTIKNFFLKDDKMYVPQIWNLRKYWETWRLMYPTAQYWWERIGQWILRRLYIFQ